MDAKNCATHLNTLAADYNNIVVIGNAFENTDLLKILKSNLDPILTQHYHTTTLIDNMYHSANNAAIRRAMFLYRNIDRGLVSSRARFKLNGLAETLNMGPIQIKNSTIVDFGSAPGHFMESYLAINQIQQNLFIPISIQSKMFANLSDDSNYYYTYIKNQTEYQSTLHNEDTASNVDSRSGDGLPRVGLLAPELYPRIFPNYDGNIYCADCRSLIVNYLCKYMKEIPPVRMLISDIGMPIEYDKETHQPTHEMDYFYLPHILLDIADTLETNAAAYYHHRARRIMIICKMQRFSYQMCHDPQAYVKLANLIMRCHSTNRHLLITKPYGSRYSNNEMYAVIIPTSELHLTSWFEPSQKNPLHEPWAQYNIDHFKYCITQIDNTMRDIIKMAQTLPIHNKRRGSRPRGGANHGTMTASVMTPSQSSAPLPPLYTYPPYGFM